MAKPRRYDRFGRPNPRGQYTKRRLPGGTRRTQLVRLPRKDHALRLPTLTPGDRIERVGVRDPGERKVLSDYWHAVRQFVETGDDTKLRRLRRVTFVDAQGRRHRLVTDRATLRRLADRGRLAFDDFYP